MSLVQFGTNVASIRKKTVNFYNRSGSSLTIYEGMPICYMYDTDVNILGLNKETNVKGTTTADGYQNEGRFLIVELPEIDNQDWFAGVVAAGPWCNKSVATLAYKWLDIYEPNGAIVPVRANVECVKGRTILAITDDGQALVNPLDTVPNFGSTAGASDSRPVAIAEETDDALDSNADIILARLCPNEFVHQGGQIGYELQIADAEANVAVNRMNLSFLNTSGNCQALHYRTKFTGTGLSATRGVYRFETFTTSVPGGSIFGIDNTINIDEDMNIGTEIAVYHATVRSRVSDPNLSTEIVTCMHFDYIMTGAAGGALANPPATGTMLYFNFDSAGTGPDYFLYCPGNGAINAQEVTGEAGHCLTLDADNRLIKIPIYVQGITYYLIAGEETALVNETD